MQSSPSERVMLSSVILRREPFLQVGLGKLFWIHVLFLKSPYLYFQDAYGHWSQ